MTQLCVAIFVTDPARVQRDTALAAEAGADVVELRIDELTDEAAAKAAVAASALPCIVTCRPTWEGGQSDLPDEDRIALLEATATGDARYVDLELKTLPKLTGDIARRQLVVSSH